uniref:Beta-Casp domain-containing protein n=1 Tax=Trichuris muris TaxID=70415 RepID=A0A5S6QXU5_TRIMR
MRVGRPGRRASTCTAPYATPAQHEPEVSLVLICTNVSVIALEASAQYLVKMPGKSFGREETEHAMLFCLSENPNQPCLVLKWPDGSVMLDCALDLPSILAHLPSITVFGKIMNASRTMVNCDCAPSSDFFNMGDLSVILLSHSSSFLALPFITERTGFNGAIFASEPTVQFGCQLMQEIVEYVERSPNEGEDSVKEEIPSKKKRGCLWEDFYTQEEVKRCLSKIQTIGLNERKVISGFGYVTATCSGYSIGSCNWAIETGSEKIVYLSASSNLSTHSKAFSLVELYRPEALILSSLNRHPHRDPDAMLHQFNSSIVSTLRSGGNVLIPCVPCGLTFDLLECLFSQMNGYDLSQTPVFLVSEVARNCLAYANICAEWLSEGKIARAFIPDDPFLHGMLVKTNRLRPCRSVYGSISREIRTPCVVFASHPSLRIGDAVHFLTIWKDDPANTIVITDPDYASNEVLLPFLPMKMKAVFCPIDTRLTMDQISHVTAAMQPKTVYMHASDQKFVCTQMNIPEYSFAKQITYYAKDKVLDIPCDRRWLQVAIDPKIAAECVLQDVGNGNAVAQLVGMLSLSRGSFLSVEGNPALSSTSVVQLACADTDSIFKRIEKLGFEQRKLHNSSKERIYEKDKTSVTLNSDGTHIIMRQYDERLRQCLKNTIMDGLIKL